jgi:hypothetical protein
MNIKFYLVNISRLLASYLSLPFVFMNKPLKKNKEIKILSDLLQYTKTNNFKNNNVSKTKTHRDFGNKLFNLIKKKKIVNFLNYYFIQKIFFVHNRFYIILQLFSLRFSRNWKLWKELLLENSIGKPLRFFIYPFSSGNRIRQVYHIKKFIDWSNINISNINLVFEFGGGYGCMASIFQSISKRVKYIIYDTREVLLLQYYYLKMNDYDVSLVSSKKNIFLISKLFKLKNILTKKIYKNKLLIMNWSFSETPLRSRIRIENLMYNFDYILISFQNKFDEINNINYFNKLKNKLIKNKFNVKIQKIETMKFSSKVNHFYFFAINENNEKNF